jgi:class 3 adenylate cyclase
MSQHMASNGRQRRSSRSGTALLLAARLLDLRSTHRLMLERFAARGTITILFTDIVDFTSATEEGGDATAAAILDAHDAVVVPNVIKNKGRIVKSLGDGTMAAFTNPAAAAQAAVDILCAVRDEPPVDGWKLRIRIGIDSGKPSPRGDDYIGHTVNLAARLTKRARPGEALTTDAVRRASRRLDGQAQWVERGPVTLKGLRSPLRTWRLRVVKARKKSV